jgi:hypothetical protein
VAVDDHRPVAASPANVNAPPCPLGDCLLGLTTGASFAIWTTTITGVRDVRDLRL